MKNNETKERWIQHYSSSHMILLVGEGDFSFSACLAKAFGSAANMVATCLHTEAMLWERHWTSTAHLQELKRLRGLVLYQVDVRNMNEHPYLKHMKFDVILFNFPHAGHYRWLRETDSILIRMHQDLIAAYFKTAKEMLLEEGEIHVTVRDDYPYNRWEVEKLAECAGLQLKDKVEFRKENYPGYQNKRGGNINCNQRFPLKACYTYKFTLKVSALENSDGSEVYESASTEITSIITTVEDLQI